MSEFSPLRDPVFLLTWQVHLAVVSLFALLGIWAGMTRRPWYIAPTLFLALLWLFVPLEAPEPAVVLLLSVPALAIACRIARRWLEKPKEESSEISPARWRFSLADLLWLTLIVGMLTGLSVQLWRLPWAQDPFWRGTGLIMSWPDVIISAACFCVLGVAVLAGKRQPSWKRLVLAGALLVVMLFAAAGTHQAFVKKEWMLINDWSTLVPDTTTGWVLVGQAKATDIFYVYLTSFLQFVLFLWIGLVLLPTPDPATQGRRLTPKIAASCGIGAVIVGLAIVYAEIQIRPGWPAEEFTERNDREALLLALARHEEINPRSLSLQDLGIDSGDGTAQRVAGLFDEVDELVQNSNITWFDSRFDPADSGAIADLVDRPNSARVLARSLGSQSRADWEAGRRDEALRWNLLCLRLAGTMRERCLILDALVGYGIEGIALGHLAEIRTDLSQDEIRRVAPSLQQLAALGEPVELLLERDRVFTEEAFGWRQRLEGAARRLLATPDDENEQAITYAMQQRDAKLALLRTDLALRSYQQTQGYWPESLSTL